MPCARGDALATDVLRSFGGQRFDAGDMIVLLGEGDRLEGVVRPERLLTATGTTRMADLAEPNAPIAGLTQLRRNPGKPHRLEYFALLPSSYALAATMNAVLADLQDGRAPQGANGDVVRLGSRETMERCAVRLARQDALALYLTLRVLGLPTTLAPETVDRRSRTR